VQYVGCLLNSPQHICGSRSSSAGRNIHRIPGLSDSFTAMNDDFFLTAPWNLADFVHEDGSEVSC
jgi:hypothetical protein